MGGFVGLLIIVIAFVSIVAVLALVLREKHEHEEHYIPGRENEPTSARQLAAVSEDAAVEAGGATEHRSTMTLRPDTDADVVTPGAVPADIQGSDGKPGA